MEQLYDGLKSCPFCGHGETKFREHKLWTGVRYYISSVSIYHWCERIKGQPRSFLEIKGKTREDAIEYWNNRGRITKEE